MIVDRATKRLRQSLGDAARSLEANDRLVRQAFGLLPDGFDQPVDENTAVTLTALWSANKKIAETIGSLPLHTFRRTDDGGKEPARDHSLFSKLKRKPNPVWDSMNFREFGSSNINFRGNFTAQIIRDGRGIPIELWPIPYKWVEVKKSSIDDRELAFDVRVPGHKTESGDVFETTLSQAQMFFVPGLGFNGIEGMSPITAARKALNIGLSAQKHAGRFLDNDARPAGFFSHPNTLSDPAYERLNRDIRQKHEGPGNAGKVQILEEGMEFEQVSISPEDAQLIETRKFQIREVARMFNLPPHMIQDLEDATFSNIETETLSFIKHTMRPRFVRWEHAYNNQVVPENSRDEVFVEHVVQGLLRGDAESRSSFYTKGINNGWMTPNEARSRENLNPKQGGDRLLVPLNLMTLENLSPIEDGGESDEDVPLTEDERARRRDRLEQGLDDHPSVYEFRGEMRNAEARRRLVLRFQDELARNFQDVVDEEIERIRELSDELLGEENQAFQDEVEDFYREEFPSTVRSQMEGVMRSEASMVADEAAREVDEDVGFEDVEDFFNDYMDTLADRYCMASRQQIQALVEEVTGQRSTRQDDEEPEEVRVVEQRLDEWEEKKAEKRGDKESFRLGNAVSKATWSAAAIAALRWTTFGANCPYCNDLDGTRIDMDDSFLDAGEDFEPEGADGPLNPKSDVGHPPAHDGCDCMVLPA